MTETMRGLYLVEPHGRLIWEGKKKAIVKSRKFDLGGRWIIVSGPQAYGEAELEDEPEKVTGEEFDRRFAEHRITKSERQRWWPEAEEFYLYRIKRFIPYAHPKLVDVPPGTQTIMTEVNFKDRASDVLARAGMLPDRIVLMPEALSLTGSQIYAGDRKPNDADLLLRAKVQPDDTFAFPLGPGAGLKLQRLFQDVFDVEEVHYSAELTGPNWTYLPLYDLALVKRPQLEIREVNEEEFARLEYKGLTAEGVTRALRSGSEEVHRQAMESLRRDEIKPGQMFVPLKPLRPAQAGQRQLLNGFFEFLENLGRWPLWVSPKRDGARHVLHRKGNRVWIYSDDGRDNSEQMPRLAERLKDFGAENWVMDAEIEYWEDGQHYPREAAAGAIHSGHDEHLVVNVFHILYWDETDYHNRPFSEMWKLARTLKFDSQSGGRLDAKENQLNLIPHVKVSSPGLLRLKVNSMIFWPGVEGVVVKLDDGTYPLDGLPGDPPTWVKWHKNVPLTVVVLERQETKTAGVYNYWYGIEL